MQEGGCETPVAPAYWGLAPVYAGRGQVLYRFVVGYGPFVMNTREEIVQAVEDFNAGKFGRVAG